MKRVLFLFLLVSIVNFSCRSMSKPADPYVKSDYTVVYKFMGKPAMVLPDARPATFKTISYSTSSCEYRDYGKDEKNVYYKNTKIITMVLI